MTVILPEYATPPYEWQVGRDSDRLTLVVPSRSMHDKTGCAVFLDLKTRELTCECPGFKFNGECHHVHGVKWFCTEPQFRRKGMQKTSLEAWRSIQDSLGDKQRMVFDMLKILEQASNKQLSGALSWPINCITPRIFELRDMGLVEFSHTQLDSKTGRMEIVWKPTA